MSMPTRIASEELIENPVISMTNGEAIAKVEDVQVDPNSLSIAAAITSTGGLLSRETEAVPADRVEVWGQDAILAKEPDVLVNAEELDDRDRWLSVSDEIRGYEVIAEDGTRIGKVGDVMMDGQGQIMGYEMADVAIEGRVAVANWIDVKATRSLGPDVLIVKSEFV